MKQMKFLIQVFALAALAFAGCSDDEGGGQPSVTKLELTDPAQATLSFAATDPRPQTIGLTTDATAEAIKVTQVLAAGESKAEWCVVTVKSASQITVAPVSNPNAAPRSAKFAISAGKLPPVEFTVEQDYPEPVDATLEISLEDNYGTYSFTAPAAGGEISVTTVTTNAHLWTAVFCDFMGDPITDENELPTYCTLKTSSGANGDALIINFLPNTQSTMQNGALVKISAGNAEPIQIWLNQDAPLATSLTVHDPDSWNELSTNLPVNFAKDATQTSKQQFGTESEGSFLVKVVAEGTSQQVTEAWLYAEQDYNGNVVLYPETVNTGAARKLDVILVGRNDAELFRMKVTQAGA